MRSKLIVILSIIIICVIVIIFYRSHSNKSIDDYIVPEEEAYDHVIDNFSFYAESTSDNEAIDVANILALMGVTEDIIISEITFDPDAEIDYDRDFISFNTDDADFTKKAYIATGNGHKYYVYTDTSGNLRGMHLDENSKLVELR